MHFNKAYPITLLFSAIIFILTLQSASGASLDEESKSDIASKLIQLASTEKCSGIALTKGELKRALAPKEPKRKPKLVFVTSTCTVLGSSSANLQTASVKPDTHKVVVVQCKCEKPVKKVKSPKKLVVISHNYTITEHLPSHTTVTDTVYKTIPVFSTLCTTLPVTSSLAVFCTQCVTLTKEVEIEPTETFTLTSTQLAIKRVKEGYCTSKPITFTSTTSTDCSCCPTTSTVKPVVVTKTCQVTATAISTKKVILKVQKSNDNKESCKTSSYIPWWLKGLTPNYNQAKAEAYKKQLNEPKAESNSKCLVKKCEKDSDLFK
jgi:hypothetical protein